MESVPTRRGKNRSVLGALCVSGMVASSHQLGAIKRADFEAFLRERLLPLLPAGSVLVLDNARSHHGGEIASLVGAAGCSLLYLPPYSPDFNPIELAWSWIKSRVRPEKPREDEARQRAIDQAVAAMPNCHAEAWFRRCGYQANASGIDSQ